MTGRWKGRGSEAHSHGATRPARQSLAHLSDAVIRFSTRAGTQFLPHRTLMSAPRLIKKEAVIFRVGISLGSPNVRTMGHTCGEPDKIELTTIGVKLNGSHGVHKARGSIPGRGPWGGLQHVLGQATANCAGLLASVYVWHVLPARRLACRARAVRSVG